MSGRVVIIGGGMSSKHAAEILVKSKGLTVTMIQGNRFVEWPIAMSAVLMHPEKHDQALSPDPKVFEVPGVTYQYGVATSVNPSKKTVSLEDGTLVEYDALIVATGFRMPLVYPKLGASLEERKAEIAEVSKAIQRAECVVVVGAGSVGLELAGDIRATYPEKRLVILSKSQMLRQYPDKIQAEVQAALTKLNIEVLQGDLGNVPTEVCLQQGVISISDTCVNYDVLLPAYSRGPNTGFLSEVAGMLDAKGNIKVNENLQSEAHPEIFAAGVANIDEGFVGIPKLEQQWKDAAANAAALLTGKPLKAHTEAMPSMKRPVVVSLGRAWTAFDFTQVPLPVKCCCCCGQGGFPCCPPVCCWYCCGPCACGYCCGSASGEGPAKFMSSMVFKTGAFHFKGFGGKAPAPEQQEMTG